MENVNNNISSIQIGPFSMTNKEQSNAAQIAASTLVGSLSIALETLVQQAASKAPSSALSSSSIDPTEPDIDFPVFDPSKPFAEEMKRLYKFLILLSNMPNNLNGLMKLMDFLLGAESSNLSSEERKELQTYMETFGKTTAAGSMMMNMIACMLCFDAEGASFEEKQKNAIEALEKLLSKFTNSPFPLSPFLETAKQELEAILKQISGSVLDFAKMLVPSAQSTTLEEAFSLIDQEKIIHLYRFRLTYGSFIQGVNLNEVIDNYYAYRIKDIEKEAEHHPSGYKMQALYMLLVERSNDKDLALGGLGDMLDHVQKIVNLYNEIYALFVKHADGSFTPESAKELIEKLLLLKTELSSNAQFKNIAPDLCKKIDEILNMEESSAQKRRLIDLLAKPDELANSLNFLLQNSNAEKNRSFFSQVFQTIFGTLTNLSQTTSSELQQRQAEAQTHLTSIKSLLDALARMCESIIRNLRPS